MTAEPTRREFIQAAAIAVGALILPAGLRAAEDSQFWFRQTDTGESWLVPDPASWCLQNASQPILERAQKGLLSLTEEDKDRTIRLVTRRCSLNLIEILPGRVVVHFWGQQGQRDLRPFFKTHGLARKNVEVIAFNRKTEITTAQSGEEFLFGQRLSQDWPTTIYLSKWRRRNEQEPDDGLASPKSWSGYAWDGVQSGLIPWAALKSAWRKTTKTCLNCDQPAILVNFGQPWTGMFNRKRIVEHVCLKCRRSFEEWVPDVEQWMATNLDAEVLPDCIMCWNQRVKLEVGKLDVPALSR